MDHVRPVLGQQLSNGWPSDDMGEIEHAQTLQRPEGRGLEGGYGPVGDLRDLDRRYVRERLTLRVRKPFLWAPLDGGTEPEGGELVLERSRVELGHAAGDRRMVAGTIEET
ncbi:MAG TPA: hypothetical protein VHT21_08390 [Stellaceae bacterium]|nr:hypothetical protein [Stellaceae bacterium]